MIWSVLTGIIPAIFYLIYFRRYITFYKDAGTKPAYLKHLEAFLFGISLALAIIIASPIIKNLIHAQTVFTKAFISAALLEKLGAVTAIYLVQRHHPNFNALEGIISGILVGAGFSFVENIFFSLSFGRSIVLVRSLFSVPLHLVTCGLIGYFLGISRLSSTRAAHVLNTIKAFLFSYAVHGFFDMCLLAGGMYSYIIAPMIITAAAVLELYIARSMIIPPVSSLKENGLRMEDWDLIYRQPRFERWIQKSMGAGFSKPVPFFAANRGALLWIIIAGLLITGISLFSFARVISESLSLNLKPEEQILFVSVYPVSIALILSIVGSINHEFLITSVVRIPVVFDVVINLDHGKESLITFDLTMSGCFLRTFEPLIAASGNSLYFEGHSLKSPKIRYEVIWKNHEPKENEPSGTVIRLIDPGFRYMLFLIKYYAFRIHKGIVFNLKLPGFQSIRRLFMRPGTVMQKEVVYQPGSVIFRQGEEINSFYLIEKGKVNIYKNLDSGERILIDSLEAGQIFNEMALLGNRKRNVTAECETLCVLAEARANNLEALIRNNPDFASALVRKLALRADQTQNYLTQTISYLHDLLALSAARAKNASTLIAMSVWENKDSSVKIELDKTRLARNLNMDINPDDMVKYINNSLGFSGNVRGADPKISKKIENACKGVTIEVSVKK